MEDSEAEAAETEPLVRHGHPAAGVGGGAVVGGAGDGAGARRTGGGGGGGGGGLRSPARHYTDSKPRLSLVPETSERSSEEEPNEDNNNTKFDESPTPFCPFFGVKNYLHHFYEKPDVVNSSLYEDLAPGEQVFLVKQTEGGCSSSVFRLSLILGGLLLLLGVVAFIIAACAARKTIYVSQNGEVSIVDHMASSHNAQIDALLLVGLVAVTLGSTVVAAALISRTFCSRPEEPPYPFRHGQYVLEPPLSPTDKKVPVTERLTQVQPTWVIPGYSSVRGIMPLP